MLSMFGKKIIQFFHDQGTDVEAKSGKTEGPGKFCSKKDPGFLAGLWQFYPEFVFVHRALCVQRVQSSRLLEHTVHTQFNLMFTGDMEFARHAL